MRVIIRRSVKRHTPYEKQGTTAPRCMFCGKSVNEHSQPCWKRTDFNTNSSSKTGSSNE